MSWFLDDILRAFGTGSTTPTAPEPIGQPTGTPVDAFVSEFNAQQPGGGDGYQSLLRNFGFQFDGDGYDGLLQQPYGGVTSQGGYGGFGSGATGGYAGWSDLISRPIGNYQPRNAQTPTSPGQTITTDFANVDGVTPSANVLKWRKLIEENAARTGLPPEVIAALIHNESGGNERALSAPNNMGGKPIGRAQGLIQLVPYFHSPKGQVLYDEDLFDPATNLRIGSDYFAGNLRKYGSLDKAMAVYFGGGNAIDANGNIRGDLGDMNITIGNYLKKFHSTVAAYRSVFQQPVASASGGNPSILGQLTPNQFNSGLSSTDAASACGPAAAVAFARYMGRNPSLQEATMLARQYGWTPGAGTAGPQAQVALLKRMGVQSILTPGVDWNMVATMVQRGKPVIVDTAAHYFVAEGYDPQTGKFDFGNSALVLRKSGGRRWLSPAEVAQLGAGYAPRSTIYMA